MDTNSNGMTSNASGMHTAGMPSCATKDFSTVSSSETPPAFIYLKIIFLTSTNTEKFYEVVQLIPNPKEIITVIQHEEEGPPKPARKHVYSYSLRMIFIVT